MNILQTFKRPSKSLTETIFGRTNDVDDLIDSRTKKLNSHIAYVQKSVQNVNDGMQNLARYYEESILLLSSRLKWYQNQNQELVQRCNKLLGGKQ